jgi:hypothetical protein
MDARLSRRGALGMLDYVIDGRGKLIHARARDDDRVSAAVGFLGDAKEFAAVVLAEFYVEMLSLYLQLPCLDEIIHVCKKPRSLGRSASKREAVFFGKKSRLERSVNNCFRGGSTPPLTLLRALISDGEVDLAFQGIDSRYENTNFVSD